MCVRKYMHDRLCQEQVRGCVRGCVRGYFRRVWVKGCVRMAERVCQKGGRVCGDE